MSQSPTRGMLRPVAPLLGGVALLMTANGLQASLVALRATAEGFGTAGTGLVASAYFVGFLIGALSAGRLVRRVGHIRSFGAVSAVASIAVLVHVISVTLPVWLLARTLSGICVSALLVLIESWINGSVDNRSRGKALSAYMIVTTLGYILGQTFLGLASVESFELFVLVSILLSAAAIPVLISRRANPHATATVTIGIRSLIRRTPAGAAASAMAGLTWGAIIGWSAVVAVRIGLAGTRISLFVGAFLVGHALFEGPVGFMSDRMDRRLVLTVIATLAAVAALVAALSGDSPAVLVPLALVIGGATLPLYSMSIALAADRLEVDELVGASGALVRINGAGAAVGPLLVAVVSGGEPRGFFAVIAGGTGVVALMGAALLLRRASVRPRTVIPWLAGRATPDVTAAAMRMAAATRRRKPPD